MLVHARYDVEDGHGEDEHGADEHDHEEPIDDLREHAPLVLYMIPLNTLPHLRADLPQMQQNLLDHRQVLALRDQHLQLVVHAVQTVPAAAASGGTAADTATVVDRGRDSLVLPPPAVGRRHLAEVEALGAVGVEDAQQAADVAEDERPQPAGHGAGRVLVVQVEHDDAREDRHRRHHHHHREVDRCNRHVIR